jgi:outer membrane protein assembly factor BamA
MPASFVFAKAFACGAFCLILTVGSSTASAQELSIRPLIGGLTADAGFALGAEVRRNKLLGPVDVRVKALGSVRKYGFLELGFEIPQLVSERLSFTVTGRYRNFPQEDFWGIGPNTKKDQRTNYLLEDVDTTGELGLTFGRFRTAANLGWTKVHIGAGHDRDVASIPQELRSPARYNHFGLSAGYDTRDETADPHKGGAYEIRWTRFLPDFQRFEAEARHFVPFGANDRLALRLRTVFTDRVSAQGAPFYLLPTVGGSGTNRGFNHYRFRDKNAMVGQAEYRHPLASIADLVVFADSGRVFAKTTDLSLRNLHSSVGTGARLKFGTRVFVGIDVAISREGARLWLRSNHTF